MEARKGTLKEMQALWEYSNSNTYNYFSEGIRNEIIELITIEDNNKLIAELYIFWDSPDKDEANSKTRAYLCALRVEEPYRQKGLSSKLFNYAIDIIKSKNFTEVTIGVDTDNEDKLSKIYQKWGFDTEIKRKYQDLHGRDKDNQPVELTEPYLLLLKKI